MEEEEVNRKTKSAPKQCRANPHKVKFSFLLDQALKMPVSGRAEKPESQLYDVDCLHGSADALVD